MSAKAGKRPLRSLTAHEKLDAIRRVHDGESKASVARDIGVPESTLRGWCKNEDKISYLSRQSTPETDDSAADTKEKRPRIEEPFNLSVKSSPVYSPTPEIRYAGEAPKPDITPDKKPENGYAKLDTHHHHHHLQHHSTPKSSMAAAPISAMSERERNRAELARLSIELGLNRPEMFAPTINTLAPSLPANMTIMNQWTSSMLAGSKKPAATAESGASQPTAKAPEGKEHRNNKTDKNQSMDDSVWYWLQTQQAMMGLVQNTANPSVAAAADHNSSWFWKWYKQFAYTQQLQQADKPILYQQLTKDKDSENQKSVEEKPTIKSGGNNKARAVLDNLLLNNNNNVAVNKKDSKLDDGLSQSEALEHGEKFLKWLEHCSEPSVTAMQILQFRYLLSNIKNGADRKNGEQKTKVKRK